MAQTQAAPHGDAPSGPIAVNVREVQEFGCPYCGFRSAFTQMSGRGAAVLRCGDNECGRTYVALADGVTVSPIGFGGGRCLEEPEYPELRDHPRRGIPAHGSPDKRPDGGGECFGSRGIGYDRTSGCFVCGGADDLRHNIAAFVSCRAAGERVVAMFVHGARLDYREFEPDYVQVKVGACDAHQPNLERLHTLTRDANGVITEATVAQARAA